VSQQPIIHWSGATVSGTRKERNDDSWIVFSSNLDGANVLGDVGENSLTNQDMVFAVSDGMGGGNAGDLASSLILEQMALMIPQTFKAAASGFFPDSITHLEEALKEVHEHINQAASQAEDKKGMAATLALAWFTPDNIYLANVGDSRVYRCHDGKTEQLTRDHTAAWASWKRGEIQEIEYRQHPRRAALYEVVGGGHPRVCPYFAAIPYAKGDRFLICSDGLIDGIWERHIAEALAKSETPQQTAEGLLKRSIENSGVDDTTLVVIHVG
jgi:serine/threonine protein phosphatase PrpC